MAKPIVIFTLRMSDDRIDSVREALEKKLYDYHVFVFTERELDEKYVIETYYEKDFTDVQYAELKAIIEEKLSGKEL